MPFYTRNFLYDFYVKYSIFCDLNAMIHSISFQKKTKLNKLALLILLGILAISIFILSYKHNYRNILYIYLFISNFFLSFMHIDFSTNFRHVPS